MFGFFIDGNFFGFWQNKVNDVFCLSTIENMGWDQDHATLVYYSSVRVAPEHFDFDEQKNLIIKNKVVTETSEEYVDENGETQTRHFTVESFTVNRIIEADVFFQNGLMIKPC